MAFLRLFEKASDQELETAHIEVEAAKCMILSVKVPTIVDFKSFFTLKAIKFMSNVSFCCLINIYNRKTKKYLTSFLFSLKMLLIFRHK